MMLTGEGDPINARKLAVGFVQSLGGISFLKLFRISFLPQERDAPVDPVDHRNVYIHRLKRNLKIMAVLIIDCWFARNSATDFMSCSFIFDSLGTRQASNIKPIQSSSSKSSVANCIFLMWQNNVHEKDELAKLNAKIPRQFQLQLITFMNIELTGHNHAIPCQTKYCRPVHDDRPHLVDNIQDLLKSFLERASVPSLDWGESH